MKVKNNIEWLRLVFAIQVMVIHSFHHIKDENIALMSSFPGVPAFFFISGFLIYASFKKSSNLKKYFLNRALRLLPGLIFVTFAAILLTIYAKGIGFFFENIQNYVIWFLSQITLGQAYNAQIFRDVGVGVINGSLWTITVEILFYISVPIIIFFERYNRHTVLILMCLSFLLYFISPVFLSFEILLGKTVFDFLKLTPIIWGWMFLSGIMCFKYYDYIYKHVQLLKWLSVILLFLIIYDANGILLKHAGNYLGLFYYIAYIGVIFYLAFGLKYVPLKFDISYGVYIWHMVIINFLLVVELPSVLWTVVLTFLLSFISWYCVEKPSLKLKHYSIRQK